MTTSHNIAQVNYSLEAYNKILHTSPFIFNTALASNEIISMLFMSRTRYNCSIFLNYEMKKM